MAQSFSLEPKAVGRIETPYRRIVTPIPVPESLPLFRQLHACEPDAMTGMAPVIWDRAQGCSIFDPYGNMWLDWTSGVLAANAGHGRREVVHAICEQAGRLLFSYAHPTEVRAKLAARLTEIAPPGLDRVFFFTSGAESVECAIKLSRMHGRKAGGDRKTRIVSFANAFHGRTLGAQLAGGIPAMKEWIGPPDATFVQVHFPDGYVCDDASFEVFVRSLREQNVEPEDVAGVLMETFQGGDANFAPEGYVRELAAWCRRHDAVLTCDEIQAGFGRTGRLFGFEHYGIVPDLACFAKGLSGALPLSAVMGRAELMDGFPPRSMTTTYGGNPVCLAGALANVELILAGNLPARAERTGRLLHGKLQDIARRHDAAIGFVHGRGLVAAVHFVRPGTRTPDPDLAFRIVESCVRQGLMLFAPVGLGAASIKICPPLVIEPGAVEEGAELLGTVIEHERRRQFQQ